jgi:hypothetical protein
MELRTPRRGLVGGWGFLGVQASALLQREALVVERMGRQPYWHFSGGLQ